MEREDAGDRVLVPVIHRLPDVTDEEATGKLPWQGFDHDWFGAAARPGEAEFRLAADGARFRFEARTDCPPPEAVAGEVRGAFLEGLWTRDVAEIFLGRGDGSYLEWNLSPRGAWWAQGLVGYREPDPGFRKPAGVRAWGTPHGSGWRGGLVFPWDGELPGAWRVNVTWINGTREGRTRWFAAARVPGVAPDFHREDQFPEAREEKFGGSF